MKFLIYLLPVLYALSPYDLIPDFLLGGGWIDDLALIGLVCWYYFSYKKKAQAYHQSYQQFRGAAQDGHGRSNSSGEKEGDGGRRNPYEVLGIEKGATSEEIKYAYRELVNKYHPDKVNHLGDELKKLAEKKFKEIQEAYQDLTARSR